MQFISQYQINPDICDSLVALFKAAKKSNLTTRGHIGSQEGSIVDKTIKDSYDLMIANTPDQLLEQYDYPAFMGELKNCVDQYLGQHKILQRLGPFHIGETPVIQHYKPGGGFKTLHFERSGLSSTTRWLTWMAYLNDVKHGGGTYFKYQDFTATPQRGTLLLWPSDFTHTHKGVVAPSEHKYIITGWLNFS